MATKKLAIVKKAVARSSAAPAKINRRKKRRSRGILGDVMNPTIATNGAKAAISSASGGFLAIGANKIAPATWGTGARLVATLVIGFIGHTVLQAPNLASGFVGGMVAQNNPATALNDDEFVNDDVFIQDEPMYISEAGEPLYLADDGQFYLMDEE